MKYVILFSSSTTEDVKLACQLVQLKDKYRFAHSVCVGGISIFIFFIFAPMSVIDILYLSLCCIAHAVEKHTHAEARKRTLALRCKALAFILVYVAGTVVLQIHTVVILW